MGEIMTVKIKNDVNYEIVAEFLKKIELHDTLIGEKLLVSGIVEVYKDPEKYKMNITGLLYHELAEEFNIGYSSVEKDMRMALEKAWTKGYSDLQYILYDDIISKKTGKPTVAKFIILTTDILKQTYDKIEH